MKSTHKKKSNELKLITNYFKKIESIAERMGLDVDDLISESRARKSALYTSFKKNILALAQRRIDIFNNRNNSGSSSESSIVGLTIITNESAKPSAN